MAAQKRMRVLTVVALLGVFLMLQASFGNWRLALVRFLALPAALVGAVLAAFLGDGVISLGAIAGTIPGHEIEHPMAVVILGGLVTSTLLNLFIMPAPYLRFARPMKSTAPVTTA